MSFRSLFICLIASVVGSLAGMAYALPSGQLLARQPKHLFLQTGSRTRIELHGSLLSVRLRDAPWDQVVKEIEQQTGISLRAATPLQGTLTEEFEALPLERGLRRLFRDAISDEDMAVKSCAIQALAEQGGPNTMDLLRRAYGDRDPSVRLIVVENLLKTEGALPLLQEAASDEDDAVRSLAVSWLERTTSVER